MLHEAATFIAANRRASGLLTAHRPLLLQQQQRSHLGGSGSGSGGGGVEHVIIRTKTLGSPFRRHTGASPSPRAAEEIAAAAMAPSTPEAHGGAERHRSAGITSSAVRVAGSGSSDRGEQRVSDEGAVAAEEQLGLQHALRRLLPSSLSRLGRLQRQFRGPAAHRGYVPDGPVALARHEQRLSLLTAGCFLLLASVAILACQKATGGRRGKGI